MARSIKGYISSGINYNMLTYFGGSGLKCRDYVENSTAPNPEAFLSIFQHETFYFKVQFLLGGLVLPIFIIKLLKFKKKESMHLPITNIFLK